MPETAITLVRVAKLYGYTAALKSTSLQLVAGETLALLGPNGSGKTTLLKILAGAIAPTLGGGSIYGHDLVRDRRALRGETAFLSTDSYLYDDLTAFENLHFTLTMAGRRVENSQIRRVLEEVSLGWVTDERVRSFSSGMKRRVSLARVSLLDARLLLLDEPYNNLDAEGAELVDQMVRRSVGVGHTTVLATHDVERGLGVAGHVAVLERGALVSMGPSSEYGRRRANHLA